MACLGKRTARADGNISGRKGMSAGFRGCYARNQALVLSLTCCTFLVLCFSETGLLLCNIRILMS